MRDGMMITFWGTRGSMAAPYSNRMIYGGNTSCVSARWKNGFVIFDGGTGIRELGMRLLKEERGFCGEKKEVHIFISHLHLDHIIGLPFFPQLFMKGWKIHFYGVSRTKQGFQKELMQVSMAPFWPVSFEQAKSEIIWHEITVGNSVKLPGDAVMYILEAEHPNGASLFRLEAEGTSVVYGLDCELTESMQRSYEAFARGCNLLIFDGMYTEEEYLQCKGYGHSSWMQGVKLARVCDVERLCISHHDWARSDEEMSVMEKKLKRIQSDAIFAREGMSIILNKRE